MQNSGFGQVVMRDLALVETTCLRLYNDISIIRNSSANIVISISVLTVLRKRITI